MGYFKTVDRIRESGIGNQFLVPYLGIYYQCFKVHIENKEPVLGSF